MKIINGKTELASYIFSTDLPDGEYNNADMCLKIADGENYPNYPIFTYLVDSISNPVFPLLPKF